MLEASMIVIGDEILGGHVTDTNSGWLAGRLREHGIPFTRIHTVADEFDAIDEALQAEVGRGGPRLIVTSGGIGSTPDDLTYEAIAASLDREVVEHPVLAERITMALEWTRGHGVDVDGDFSWHMLRMARVPDGGTLLDEDGSWAPGVRVDLDGGIDDDGITICVLPGVPGQFRAIVDNVIAPELMAGRNPVPTVLELTHTFPESSFNLCFVDLLARYPDVKLGSYPGTPMLIRLTGQQPEVGKAFEDLTSFAEELAASPAGQSLQRAWSARFQKMEDRQAIEEQNRLTSPSAYDES